MTKSERNNVGIRPISIEPNYTQHAEGSCLIKTGQTWVLVTASVEEKVPPFLLGKSEGWVTAEYAMLPRSTHTRNKRESRSGKPSGRSLEISRLIGRALRACIDTKALGERSITVDCDVLQADGGTRIASINGGYVALQLAIQKLIASGKLKQNPITSSVGGISLGIKNNEIIADLDYDLDSSCDVDMNIVMLENGEIVEMQGTAERGTFSTDQAAQMLDKAKEVLPSIFEAQNKAINA